MTKAGEVQGYVKAAMDAYGRIDCFFNNAGIEGKLAAIVDMDEAVFDQVLGVNVKGVFLGLRAVLPVMIAQKSGAVVNTASVAGGRHAGMSAYVASKTRCDRPHQAADGEVARSGVRGQSRMPRTDRYAHDPRLEAQLDRSIRPLSRSAITRRCRSAATARQKRGRHIA